MNLFFLDIVSKKSARYHCDKHVVKLILEATQMLYSVWHLCEPNEAWKTKAPSNYMKLTHKNHPLSKWVRTNNQTYDMVTEYCNSLLEEYTLRYGKIHSSKLHMDWLEKNYPSNLPKSNDLPLMPLCMPDTYKVTPSTKWSDVVDSYRAYYVGEKLHFCSYKGVEWPEWLPPRPIQTKTEPKSKKTKTAAAKKDEETKKRVSKTPANVNKKLTTLPSSKVTTTTKTTTTTTTTTSASTRNKDYLLVPSLFNPNPILGATAPILTRSQAKSQQIKIEK
ncbi:hypothetical protein DICPUDRAFT_92059 [Dictyostelium purpureum]|uniref:Uncharacterized protein n=1 Tax=Dictyostelium purpureum TaxID=5786 RepID=F0ZLC7_DICPU|nr:uncharacterized protein DICPUDRAFT_92059 [Dictyostelium purpureum]EGC35247.1 hypothetical protein DICPUDRAFT_92059 [Dictyostelium purpureum]|eukprot:XP_003288234.1 hypothetical protein DICPUDRAFT_92059 [Dictyostelium purpureum]